MCGRIIRIIDECSDHLCWCWLWEIWGSEGYLNVSSALYTQWRRCCHHHALHCGSDVLRVRGSVGFAPHDVSHEVCHMLLGQLKICFLHFFLSFLEAMAYFLASLHYSSAQWSVRLKAVLRTDTPISAVDRCSSFSVLWLIPHLLIL